MGMAASQARFLSLTARKSNVEWEGQQVNQQRTALANESANLYNKLTSIPVPTPPTTSDYYTTVYTFTTSELDETAQSGSTEYTLNNIYTTPDGTYANLSYTAYEWQTALSRTYSGDVNSTVDPTTGKTGYSVSLADGSVHDAVKYHYVPSNTNVTFELQDNHVQLGNVDFSLDDTGKTISGTDALGNPYSYEVIKNSDGTYTMTVAVEQQEEGESYTTSVGGVDYNVIYDEETGTYSVEIAGANESDITGKYVNDDGKANAAVGYFDDGFLEADGLQNQPVLAYTIGNQTYFVSASEFKKGDFASSSFVQSVGHEQRVDYPCTYTTAATGRYQTITVTDDYGMSHTFTLNVQSVEDEEAYAQAMLDYEYSQAKYEKQIADINAKTEKIQQEDRTLELRLKQLDTEQNAISTEMDAVKKVIEDNIEATFKTFA